MKRSLFHTVLLLLLCSVNGYGQRHYFVSYSVREGLAQSQVRDVIQTSDGYLWIATVGGVSRFDGLSFKSYTKNNGLPNNLANSLLETEDGDLMIACQGSLVRIVGDSHHVIPFPEEFKNVITMDMVEYQGKLVIATNGDGLILYDDGVFKRDSIGPKGMNFVRSLSVLDGQLLVGTKKGLIAGDLYSGWEFVMRDVSVMKIAQDERSIWIATSETGVFRIDPSNGLSDANGSPPSRQYTTEDGLQSMFQRDICIDHEGNPWLISKNGMLKYNAKRDRFDPIYSIDPGHSSNLKVLYTDLESNIWIGTEGAGILKYTGDQFETFTVEDGLVSDLIVNIDQQPSGDIWFATFGDGVMHGTVESGFSTIDFDQGLANNTVWSLEVISDEEIWMGTSEGITIYRSGKLIPFAGNDDLPFPRVSVIRNDELGWIWIGTRDGLVIWAGDSLFVPKSIAEQNIREVKAIEIRNGTVWISSSNGLYSYHRATGKVAHFNKTSGLFEEYLTCMKFDEMGTLWFGTEEGLGAFDPKTGRCDHVMIREQVSSNTVDFLETDGHGQLWIGTDNGLFSLDLKIYHEMDSLSIRSYNEHDGVVGQECNQNAAFRDASGNLWFGTNGGLVRFNPAKREAGFRESVAVRMNDVQLNFESIKRRLEFDTALFEKNRLRYDENRLTFRYSAIHYANPEKITYSYRLEGSDDDWSPPVKENYVTYANLPPGEYEFQVRARHENGDWSTDYAMFRFAIEPAFYQRWWFVLLILSVAGVLVWLIIRQVENERRRKRHLEEVQNKAKILGLEQQTLNAHMNRHFIFNALNSIQYYINTQDRKMANMYLTNFAALVRKNLDSAQVETILLKEELERLKLYMNLEQMRFKDRFAFRIEIDPDLDQESVLVPSMILQPFVENSIMHGILPSERPGLIDIRIACIAETDDVLFELRDNGIGIDTSVRQKQGTSLHVSNGMKITRQRMDLLRNMTGRNYRVEGPTELKDDRDVPCGTLVTITLPRQLRKLDDIYVVKA